MLHHTALTQADDEGYVPDHMNNILQLLAEVVKVYWMIRFSYSLSQITRI